MKHRLVIALLLLGIALPRAALAQSPLFRTIARAFTMAEAETTNFRLQCPASYIPTGYSLTLGRIGDSYEQLSREIIASNGAIVNRQTLTNASEIGGGGYTVSIFNDTHHTHNIAAVATCLATAVSADNTLVLAKASSSVASGQSGRVASFCPANAPHAIGGFSNASGFGLLETISAPIWRTPEDPLYLADVPEGQTGPPSGWQVEVLNGNIPRETIVVYTICGNVPGLQTFVYSAPTAFGNFDSVFGPVPEGWAGVGAGFDGARLLSSDVWMRDGTIVNHLLWFHPSVYDSAATEVRAFIALGFTSMRSAGAQTPIEGAEQAAQRSASHRPLAESYTARPKATGFATLAVLAVPRSLNIPPATTVEVIEFYNQALDHYFITAIPDEIAKLDNGTFVGWARTGQSFRAYAVGSTGRQGRRPVCRAYGLPSASLNTHFYSASPEECFNTLSRLYGAWALEASEVFEMDLPDPQTGACPDGDLPVYRIWNQRFDSNHRYTTSSTTRDQMVARGGVAEGYGPNAVALCALPPT